MSMWLSLHDPITGIKINKINNTCTNYHTYQDKMPSKYSQLKTKYLKVVQKVLWKQTEREVYKLLITKEVEEI